MDPISCSAAEPFVGDPSPDAPEPGGAPSTSSHPARDVIEQYTDPREGAVCKEPARSVEEKTLESVRQEARDRVEICKRDADLPLGHTLHLKHHWLRTATKEAGMGKDDGTVPGRHLDLPYVTKTTVNDHTGEGARPESECSVVPHEDAQCVDRELEIGRKLGRWTPINQCQTFVADVLSKCSTQGK